MTEHIASVAPIVLFVYNRPEHTKKTIEALKLNEFASDSDLFIFSDGPKVGSDDKVKKVKEYIKVVTGFKSLTIVEREKNFGLAANIIAGVTEIINKYGVVIVLEDDIITSSNFLKYMNMSLEKYENDERIYSISGFNVKMAIPDYYKNDVFLSYRHSSWGWATWKNRWLEADWNIAEREDVFKNKEIRRFFDRGGDDLFYILKAQINGKINSWAIRWYCSHFRKNRFTVFPVESFVENIGFDGSGIHCGNVKNAPGRPVIYNSKIEVCLPESIDFDEKINKEFLSHYKYKFKDKIRRFLKELLRYRINK